ncbi:UNVERIFIED_CONTAM: hypothetical protein FKN15_003612 [Acipenser sinensis]
MATYVESDNGSEVGSEDFGTSDSDADLSLNDYDEDVIPPADSSKSSTRYTAGLLDLGCITPVTVIYPLHCRTLGLGMHNSRYSHLPVTLPDSWTWDA